MKASTIGWKMYKMDRAGRDDWCIKLLDHSEGWISGDWKAWAREDYIKRRFNHTWDNSFVRPETYDGKYELVIKSREIKIGYLQYKEHYLKYIAGPEDIAWMEKQDINYVFELETEEELDRKEPDLKTENLKLYKAIQSYRRAKTETAPCNRMTKLLEPIEKNMVDKFDFSMARERHFAYFAEVRKQIGPIKESIFVVPDFVPLSTEEINQIFQALMQNQSVKTVNFGDIDLSVHADVISAFFDERPDVAIIIPPLAQIIYDIYVMLQQTASKFTERQKKEDKVEVQPDLTAQARSRVGMF
jgi:hypothetical protein